MERIQLSRSKWWYDPDSPLGPAGGFGAVFAGEGEDGAPVAVKRLHMEAEEAAHREFRIAEFLMSRDLRYVVPFLDAGQDQTTSRYFLVMPRAEKSLQDVLEAEGCVEEHEAASILLAVCNGLREVGDLVHRDLKPGNVLWQDGHWRIADFGIARFVEESTSLRTLKSCLSPPFAAPEQWRLERSTRATDLYALGCMMYALLNGAPPFPGPDVPSFQDQHLSSAPPELVCRNASLRSLASMLLMKSPKARPSLDRVCRILDRVVVSTTGSGAPMAESPLAAAGIKAAEAASKKDAQSERRRIELERRQNLARDGLASLNRLVQTLLERIQDQAPPAECARSPAHYLEAHLLAGDLEIMLLQDEQHMMPEHAFRSSTWDVVLGAIIAVRQKENPYMWAANLWFGRIPGDDAYRWWEVGYMSHPVAERRRRDAPFAVDQKRMDEADEAASPGMNTVQFAYGPVAVDGEHSEAFFDRWCRLFAHAAQEELRRPRTLPIRDIDRYLKD